MLWIESSRTSSMGRYFQSRLQPVHSSVTQHAVALLPCWGCRHWRQLLSLKEKKVTGHHGASKLSPRFVVSAAGSESGLSAAALACRR